MFKLLGGLLLSVSSIMASAHPGFVSLSEICPSLKINADYFTTENFTGEVIPGYKAHKAFMAKGPAEILCQVQADAEMQGLGLMVFDSYRPVKAVGFFMEWALRPETNPHLKEKYYPSYSRSELFEKGYIAKKSSHSKGSAVDLTLLELKSGKVLDMGTGFDFLDELSHTESKKVSDEQRKNRLTLRKLMEDRGFKNFSQEWWHYSYRPEPYPDQYFDFDVE